MQEIKLVLTMDCEPTTATSHQRPRGQPHGAQARTGLRLREIAAQYGLPVTLFVHPEGGRAIAMFRELERGALASACTCTHGNTRCGVIRGGSLWPTTAAFRPPNRGNSLPSQQGFGPIPLDIARNTFAPGPSRPMTPIFAVLEAQGFRGGSCTAPGRLIPEMQAIWSGGQPDPHRASGVFRQAQGNLDFANMPLSADFSMLLAGPPAAPCMRISVPTWIGLGSTTSAIGPSPRT